MLSGHEMDDINNEGRDIPPDDDQLNNWQERRVFRPERQQRHNRTQYYYSEANRLSTFSDWRYERIVRREDLARNGFIYTGTADKVSIKRGHCVCQSQLLIRV
jgi:hypothetical protein